MPVILLSSSCEHVPASPAISARLSKPVKVNKLCSQMLQSLSEQTRNAKKGASPNGQVQPHKTRSLRILVAEDNPINQKIAQMMLQRLGYDRHVLVQDGEEAVAAVMDSEYDVILMDVQMPHMNGLKATQLIRKQTGEENKPWIVALTAAVMQEERAAAEEAGMNAFLAKPLVIEQLEDLLNKLEANAKP
jgi:CheY-like chemotaxis protein